MSNSTLISETVLAHPNNYWGDRKGAKVNKIIVHHMAAVWTGKRCAQSFQNPNRGASANYCIGYSGEIVLSVPENLCAGTTGGFEIDRYAITIEVSNSAVGGDWKVSDAALKSLINLCADIAKRYNFGKLVKGKNLCWHQMYAATACPGPYLLSKMDYIAEKANEINYPKEVKISMGEITGINTSRGTNALVLITDGRKTTGFNKWGCDVIVNSKGIITNVVVEKANTAIPSGCICLSGHGTNEKYLIEHCKVGSRLKIG